MSKPQNSGLDLARWASHTSYGNPLQQSNPRFFAVGRRWLKHFNKVLTATVFVSAFAIVALLVYIGFGIQYSATYASDGTAFSCQLVSVQGRK